ncbi:hypothetical protein [Paenibacillus riograndensis]|uniref:KOW domain-containing protein n=1 Tax=Paenibacillus riograndensis SBR5 TaxID=1073571 RepID=A0A0E4CU45_9BACL|nr:hypothetical protein [Paenibacillus riograndensis]CQR51495.1 hypothetical protein PRIO_0241 [Paenibacillus riograndensis SBR5]
MKWEELKPELPVRIAPGHESGFGGRTGKVVTVGTFEGYSKRIGALVDIGEPLLLIVEPEALEEASEDPLPPGWGEFEV